MSPQWTLSTIRAACLAAYPTAQALIFARTGKVAKTHSGVRNQFARIVKDDPHAARKLTTLLAQAYNPKVAGDYAVGPQLSVGGDEAAEATA